MRLGLNLMYSTKTVEVPIDLIRAAEDFGVDSVWVSEVYGADCITIASWILAQTSKIKVGTCIMQLPARTPACAAMTGMSLAQLSNDRFIMGLGASGPQVVEGWHGSSYSKPITRMREYIGIIRAICAREAPVSFEGDIFNLPYQGEGSTGLGKPLKSLLKKTNFPIYTASFTPAGLRTAAELAEGVFPVWMNPDRFDLFEPHLNEGFAKADGKGLADFDVAPMVPVGYGDDLDACRLPVKQFLALYIGGMGARSKNFYNDYAIKMGYEAEAKDIQDLYLSGHQRDAVMKVPDQLVDEIGLIGPKERIQDRAQAWIKAGKKNHVGTMILGVTQPEAFPVLAEIFADSL